MIVRAVLLFLIAMAVLAMFVIMLACTWNYHLFDVTPSLAGHSNSFEYPVDTLPKKSTNA